MLLLTHDGQAMQLLLTAIVVKLPLNSDFFQFDFHFQYKHIQTNICMYVCLCNKN